MNAKQPIERAAVVGAGVMGGGIAGVLIQAGIEVNLYDADPEVLERAKASIRSGLERAVKKKRISAERSEAALARLRLAPDLANAVESREFVIEAVVEKFEVKESIFAELDQLTRSDVILATNTSQIPITRIAATAASYPERVVGMHWFNPPARMKLIEVIGGLQTSTDTLGRTTEFCRALGKEPVRVKDRQGFLVNRALGVFLAECLRMLEENVSTAEEIDTAIKLGLGHPMGPFELADLIGLDTMLDVSEEMHRVYGDRRLPPQILRLMVAAGRLGRKSGRGFYEYE